MCKKSLNGELEGNRQGKKNLAILKKPSLVRKLIIALMVMLILSTLPLIPQTRIIVATDRDIIKNVATENPRVPLVVSLFPSPSVGKGAYTIEVKVSKNGELVFNSTLKNVPSGEYTIVWISIGTPEAGTYRITVRLLRENIEVNRYSLYVEY